MKSGRWQPGAAGVCASGLIGAGTEPPESSLLGELAILPGHFVYMQIPSADLRSFVDGLFPQLAKNPIADCTSGFDHRYLAGHDLLLDVPRTLEGHGLLEGLRHAGHVVLTDFPTRAGIPIPGFSHTGLGELLESAGIARGWLQLSLFENSLGILAIADGSSTLAAALAGKLEMDLAIACQTFGTGSVEIGLAVVTSNPLLLAGGLQDILAGLVATWNSMNVQIDPLEFFGAGFMSALIGFGLGYGIGGEQLSDSLLLASRSGVVAALFKVSMAFGFGALAAMAAVRIGQSLADQQNVEAAGRMTVGAQSYRLLVETLGVNTVGARSLVAAGVSFPALHFSPARIPGYSASLAREVVGLLDTHTSMDRSVAGLDASARSSLSRRLHLSADAVPLDQEYQRALSLMRQSMPSR
jgi:hypothetical protein